MGFFSELKGLGKDLGNIVKDCAKDIGDITKNSVREFKDDPLKYTCESVVEIAKGAAKTANYVNDEILPRANENISKNNYKFADKALRERNDLTDEQVERLTELRDNSKEKYVEYRDARRKNEAEQRRTEIENK